MSGWPDEARPGVPLNPERDGWHWLLFPHPANQPKCRRWTRLANGQFDWVNLHDANLYDYLGPCLTPAEVAAQLTAAQAERDLTRPDEEITRLRAALRQIAEYDHLGDPAAIAREALGLPPTED